jgi:hypothetical protein
LIKKQKKRSEKMKRRLTVVLLALFTAIFAVSCDFLLPDEGSAATSDVASSTPVDTTLSETTDADSEPEGDDAKTTEKIVETVESEKVTEADTSAADTAEVLRNIRSLLCQPGIRPSGFRDVCIDGACQLQKL